MLFHLPLIAIMSPDPLCRSNRHHSFEQLRHLLNEVNDLIADINSLNDVFDAVGQTLIRARTNELEDAILCIFYEKFDPVEHAVEYAAGLELLRQYGPAYFIKKALWGEDLDSVALSMALEKLIPFLEQLVVRYPMILLDQAASSINAIKNRASSK